MLVVRGSFIVPSRVLVMPSHTHHDLIFFVFVTIQAMNHNELIHMQFLYM